MPTRQAFPSSHRLALNSQPATRPAQAGRVLPYDGYRVGPFQGLTVRLSGLSAARKAALAGLVAGGGGVHSPALDKKCTHLVTVSTQSEKYKWVRGGGGGGGGAGGHGWGFWHVG